MAKKKLFKHYPNANAFGQYHYTGNSIDEAFISSSGVQTPYNKFSDNALYATSVGDPLNEKILAGGLRFKGSSNITIDRVRIDNSGVSYRVRRTHARGFIFDRNTFDCYDENQSLKSYDDMYDGIYNGIGLNVVDGTDKDSSPWHTGCFMDWDMPSYDEKKGPGELDFLSGQTMVSNLNRESTPSVGEFANLELKRFFPDVNNNLDGNINNQPFNPSNQTDSSISNIFQEDDENNYIQVVFWLKGDRKKWKHGRTRARRKRFEVFKISQDDLFIKDSEIISPTTTTFEFTSADTKDSGGSRAAAWKVTNFSLTITTAAGAGDTYSPPQIYNPITGSITAGKFFNIDTFATDYIAYTLTNEISSIHTGTLNQQNYFTKNYIPVPHVTLGNESSSLQEYKSNYIEQQKHSAPSSVSLTFSISEIQTTDDYILENNSEDVPPYYKFFVVDWDDKENKYKTLDDVLNDRVVTQNDIKNLQRKNNTYIFNDLHQSISFPQTPGDNPPFQNPLVHNYTTSGIKTIKAVVFSYVKWYNVDNSNVRQERLPFMNLEPVRWKLVTCRLYLDIPISEFPDFGEVGGSDFTTIPWPYTTPIIGGVSKESKYLKSVTNTLQGGKISNTSDINDRNFLINARDNDELGKNIEKLDLEQARFFNTGSYDINKLLGIYVDTKLNLLEDLPFPQYFEEFDIAPLSTNGDRILDVNDAVVWANIGRSDIAEYLYPLVISSQTNTIPSAAGGAVNPPEYFFPELQVYNNFVPHNALKEDGSLYWDGNHTTSSFSKESSVGQIFIGDNSDVNLKANCKLEINTGNLEGKSIYDSSGNLNKGLLIGDYKITKPQKNRPMRRDSFIKVPKKIGNTKGAL